MLYWKNIVLFVLPNFAQYDVSFLTWLHFDGDSAILRVKGTLLVSIMIQLFSSLFSFYLSLLNIYLYDPELI